MRDVTGRIISHTITPSSGPASTLSCGFSGDGDSPDWTIAATGGLLEHPLALPGGVIVSLQSSTAVGSFPNIYGDVITTTTTDGSSTRHGRLAC